MIWGIQKHNVVTLLDVPKSNSQRLPASIKFNLGTKHYRKVKESDNTFLISGYTILFTSIGVKDPQLTN